MTSSTAETNGNDTSIETKPAKKEHGLAVLREAESRALISIACDSLHQSLQVAHQMHSFIYGPGRRRSP
jgi:hypothetical protein